MGASQRIFFPGPTKIKKYFDLKRSCKELKLCALKIKIKFDDIISIIYIISGCLPTRDEIKPVSNHSNNQAV
jgi:hypothetical protein